MRVKSNIRLMLDAQLASKNSLAGLMAHPDPLWVAREQAQPTSALLCALFAYGNAGLIVKFLRSLNYELLDMPQSEISAYFRANKPKYRFQSEADVEQIFISLALLKKHYDIEQIIIDGMQKGGIEMGISALIKTIYSLNPYRSNGYEFFFGKSFERAPTSPLKRYNMYLRWMVRDSDIDMGLFKRIDKSELLIPLDVHTHRTSLRLGLIKRKSYDFKAVLELSEQLRKFDPKDPIKYDFALYRLGQLGELDGLDGL